jgi:hypothetical protein
MGDGVHSCVNSASITDCSRYINESGCNSRSFLDGNERRGCFWSDNGCARFECDNYGSIQECVNNGKNVSDVCFWNSGSCSAVGEITTCAQLDQSNCGDSSIMGECFWNGAGDSGSCKSYDEITSCLQLDDVESCRKTKGDGDPFVSVANCAWVGMEGAGECKMSEEVDDCDLFYLSPDCIEGISYPNGSTKRLIYCFVYFYFFF